MQDSNSSFATTNTSTESCEDTTTTTTLDSNQDKGEGMRMALSTPGMTERANLADVFTTNRSLAKSVGRLFVAVIDFRDASQGARGHYDCILELEGTQVAMGARKAKKKGTWSEVVWNSECNFMVGDRHSTLKFYIGRTKSRVRKLMGGKGKSLLDTLSSSPMLRAKKAKKKKHKQQTRRRRGSSNASTLARSTLKGSHAMLSGTPPNGGAVTVVTDSGPLPASPRRSPLLSLAAGKSWHEDQSSGDDGSGLSLSGSMSGLTLNTSSAAADASSDSSSAPLAVPAHVLSPRSMSFSAGTTADSARQAALEHASAIASGEPRRLLSDAVRFFNLQVELEQLVDGQVKEVKSFHSDGIVCFNARVQFVPQEQELKFRALEDFLIGDDDMRLVAAIADTTSLLEIDSISTALINLFAWNGKGLKLLNWAIHREIESTSRSAQLFREQSLAVKMFSEFVFQEGKTFLRSKLVPFLAAVEEEEHPIEIDPKRMLTDGEKRRMEGNKDRLVALATALADSIFDAVDELPLSFKVVAQYLQRHVAHKFPDHVHTTLSGFFFLRFFIPSLVTPEAYSILPPGDEIEPKMRRTLVLIGKLLTNMANRVRFGDKEQYLVSLNAWIDAQGERIHTFFDHLLAPIQLPDQLPITSLRKRFHYNIVHGFVHKHMSRLFQLIRLHSEDAASSLRSIVNELGIPEEEIQAVETLGIVTLMRISRDLRTALGKRFSGSRATTWLANNCACCSHRVDGMLLGERLVDMELVVSCQDMDDPFSDDEHVHFRVADLTGSASAKEVVLNGSRSWRYGVRAPRTVAFDLLQGLSSLYLRVCTLIGTVLSDNDTLRKVVEDPDYQLLRIASEELQRVSLTKRTSKQLHCFWINVHNLLALHAHAHMAGCKGKYSKSLLLHKLKYNVCGFDVSLVDIAYGVLRHGLPAPSGVKRSDRDVWTFASFPASDKRNVLTEGIEPDPNVLFCLCHGFASSPVIRVYREESWDDDVQAAARDWLRDHVRLQVAGAEPEDAKRGAVSVGKAFAWHWHHFGATRLAALRSVVRTAGRQNDAAWAPLFDVNDEPEHEDDNWTWHIQDFDYKLYYDFGVAKEVLTL